MTLDLSGDGRDTVKVKLPDGELYDLADPDELGALDIQQAFAKRRQAAALMGKTDATEDDIEEMLGLLVDICCVAVPDAPRHVVGRLSLPRLERLVEAFSEASRADGGVREAATSSTGDDS